MTHTTISRFHDHPVHLDPIDAAISVLVDSALVGRLVCDGTCNALASCTIAPVDALAPAA